MTKTNVLYKSTEYQLVDLGGKKMILSTLDSLKIGDGTDLGADFSDTEIMIFAEDLVLAKKIQAKSVTISAYEITTVTKKTDTKVSNGSKTIFLQTATDLALKNKKILQVFDYSNGKYLTITANSFGDNLLKFDESTVTGTKIDSSNFMFAHPTQCSMLLQKAQQLYREADPINNKAALDQAIIYLQRLRDRTKIFKDLKETSSLAKLYSENEKDIGAINSVETFKNIYNTADNLIGQIAKGNDYYGNSYNYVPLASFPFYQSILKQQVDNFGIIEKTFLNFFNADRAEKDKIEDLKNARYSLNSIKSQADSQIQDLKVRIRDVEIEIAGLQSQFKEKQNTVKEKIENFKDAVEHSFYLDIKSLFSSLTTLAFLSESPAGWILAGGQAGYDIYEGAKSVENDQGIPIKKEYLVSVLKSFEGDLTSDSLDEQYKKLDDGTIQFDDPGANKLIAEEGKVEKFLSDFYAKFTDQVKELEDAFRDYVNHVLARNNKITYYNAMVTIIIKNHNLIKDANNKIVVLNDQNLKDYQPDLPAFISLMSALYADAQSQVMSSLYLTERAFQFWSLSDEKPVANIFSGKKVVSINQAVLESAQSAILQAYGKAVENYRLDAQSFPTNDSDNGVIWNLSQNDINTLKKVSFGKVHSVFFSIPASTLNSKVTDNPFASYADVRVRKVRVWLEGVTTSNNQVVLKITHNGNETIYSSNDQPFAFEHNSKEIRFEYNLKTKKVIQDGDIGHVDKNETYALVGPFTWWTITIKPNDNVNLDLSKLTKVSVDFHGTNYVF